MLPESDQIIVEAPETQLISAQVWLLLDPHSWGTIKEMLKDSSQAVSWLLWEVLRRHRKRALGGQAADKLSLVPAKPLFLVSSHGSTSLWPYKNLNSAPK